MVQSSWSRRALRILLVLCVTLFAVRSGRTRIYGVEKGEREKEANGARQAAV